MRNYRFKRQTNKVGTFAGVTAETLRSEDPPADLEPISDRVWLDASRVVDGFRGTPLTVSEEETDWLRVGLRRVADDIERATSGGHVVVAVRALEIVEVDYIPAALAPAIAGWAAEEFGFPLLRADITHNGQTNQHVVTWTD
ncbi:hypothetical protein [Asanoa siamensis]|uniref:Uncharacterized protein n=1 Tax=Asanoa siamensis TaxID=926357 RepID=A0ABQ4CMA5_9ACTN|nr:hypothetical protein [Asanoa siamensis]GIF72431.1 hypothetical protein Asi02nite_19490 [Asanoa siamensis]